MMKTIYRYLLILFSVLLYGMVQPVFGQYYSPETFTVQGRGDDMEITIEYYSSSSSPPNATISSVTKVSGSTISIAANRITHEETERSGSSYKHSYMLSLGFGLNSTTSQLQAVYSISTSLGTFRFNITQLAGTVAQVTPGSVSPASQTIISGNSASSLSHTGYANVTSRQWQQSTNGSTWSNISGATGTNYSPGSITNNSASPVTYYYRVQATGSSGTQSSSTASITVNPAGNVGSITPYSQSILSGSSASTLSHIGYSSVTSRQWQRSINGGNWSNLGMTGTSYSPGAIYNTGTSAITYSYRLQVTINGQTNTTPAVSVTINPILTAGSVSPSSQSIQGGRTPTSMSHTGFSNVTSRQWQISGNGGASWSNISGATGASYNPGTMNALSGEQTTYYYRVQATGFGQTKTSSAGSITVTPPFKAGSIYFSSQTINSGSSANTLTHQGYAMVTSRQWQESRDGGSTWSNIYGATGTTYNPGIFDNFGTTVQTRYYRVLASGNGQTGYSSTALITINPATRAHLTRFYGAPSSVDHQHQDVIGTYEVATVAANDANLIRRTVATLFQEKYGWDVEVEVNQTGSLSGTISMFIPANISTAARNVSLVVGGATISFQQNAIPGGLWVFNTAGGGNIPSGGSTTIDVRGSQPSNVQYQLVNANSGAIYATKNGLGALYVPLSFTVNQVGTYKIRAVYGPSTVWMNGEIEVYSTLALNPITVTGPTTVVQGENGPTLSTSASGGTGVYSYQWEYSTNGVNWYSLGSNSSVNTGPLSTTTYYKVTVTSGSQSRTSDLLTVTVLSKLNLTISGNQNITENQIPQPLSVTASGGTNNYTYQWAKQNGSTWEVIPGAIQNTYAPSALTQDTRYRVTVVSGTQTEHAECMITVSRSEDVNVALSTSENYIVKYAIRKEGVTLNGTINTSDVIPSVVYFDGLGRPKQQVEVAASSLGHDIRTPIWYDEVGRADAKQYLPYPDAARNMGAYTPNAFEVQRNRYAALFNAQDAQTAFVQNIYEASPLNRVIARQNAGRVYEDNQKQATFGYLVNANNEVLDLRIGQNREILKTGYYTANSLYKNESVNEDGLAGYTFTDKAGRTILERTMDGTTQMDTYYIYDDLGRLRWVASPMGSAEIMTRSETSFAHSDTTAVRWCYYYEYDGEGRIIVKRLPGNEEPTEYVYDSKGRLVATRSGNEEAAGQWALTRYDNHDRPTDQWMLTAGDDRSTMANNYSHYYTSGTKTLLASYAYDSYPAAANNLGFNSGVGIALPGNSSKVKGFKTYEKLAILGSAGQTIERAFYYDAKGRLIQTVEKNHLDGTSRYSTRYDFMGNPLQVHEQHSTSSGTHTVLTTNTYDHRNRLLTTTTQLGNSNPATVTYTYDELGQLKTKNLGNVSTVTHDYNIQGWLTDQGSRNFTMKLDYFDENNFAGNIIKWSWGHGTAVNQYYDLAYDAFNRLTGGTHSLNKFNETGITYDLNGNIGTLSRKENSSVTDYGYHYVGNQLSSLDISGPRSGDYDYDSNGNMTIDPRKNLKFTYNSLNLVQQVNARNANGTIGAIKAQYLYAADGTKLKVQDSGNTSGYDYLGSVTLVKDGSGITPEAAFAEGIIRGSNILFFEKDHLGSVRTVLNTTGGASQYIDYYPFGMEHPGQIDNVNRYRFNGKEKQITGGLDLIDYGWRMYDQQIGRWFGLDKLAEKHFSISPYAFIGNNPIRRIELDGRDWVDKVIGVTRAITDNFFGTSTRDSYTAKDQSDYVEGLLVGDAASVVIGASMINTGTGSAAAGVVAASETGGLSLAYSAAGVGAVAWGTFAIGNAAKNATTTLSQEGNGGGSSGSGNSAMGKRRQNRLPDTGEPNSVQTNEPGSTSKRYGSDGNVQKEFNRGHQGRNVPKNEQSDHIHDYKPNPNNPSGRGERQPGRPLKPHELERDFNQ